MVPVNEALEAKQGLHIYMTKKICNKTRWGGNTIECTFLWPL